jgi:hypothetical protein
MRLCQIGDASIAVSKMFKNSPPGWIGQRGERAIQRLRIIFNHLVKYMARVVGHATKNFSPAK